MTKRYSSLITCPRTGLHAHPESVKRFSLFLFKLNFLKGTMYYSYLPIIKIINTLYSPYEYPYLLCVCLTRPSPVALDWPQTIQLPNGKRLSVCVCMCVCLRIGMRGLRQSRKGLRFNANAMRCSLQACASNILVGFGAGAAILFSSTYFFLLCRFAFGRAAFALS